MKGDLCDQNRRIYEALVVGTEQIRACAREFFHATDLHGKQPACERTDETSKSKPQARSNGPLFIDGEDIGIFCWGIEDLVPADLIARPRRADSRAYCFHQFT